MKIAVSTTGNNLDSEIDPRFGRASSFLIVDSETLEFSMIDNNQASSRPQGAGIQAGKTIVDQHVDVVITGNCGPKAFQVLNQAGIQIITGANGKVSDAIQLFKDGAFNPTTSPNVVGHWS